MRRTTSTSCVASPMCLLRWFSLPTHPDTLARLLNPSPFALFPASPQPADRKKDKKFIMRVMPDKAEREMVRPHHVVLCIVAL